MFGVSVSKYAVNILPSECKSTCKVVSKIRPYIVQDNYHFKTMLLTFENFLNFQKEVRTQLRKQNLLKIPARKLVLLIEEKKIS